MSRYVSYNIFVILQAVLKSTSTPLSFLEMVFYPAMVPMIPRFIVSIRELYDRDLVRRWQGIDSGFGVISQPVADENAVVSAIAFADVNPGRGEGQVEGDVEDPEAIRLEVLGDGARQA